MQGQMDRLQACTAQLQRARCAGRADRATQAELGGGGSGARCARAAAAGRAADPLGSFQFQQPSRRVNWRRVHATNIQQLVRSRRGKWHPSRHVQARLCQLLFCV